MKRKTRLSLIALAIAVVVLSTFTASAAAQTQSLLDEILKRGTVRVAVMMDMMPSGGRDARGNPIGRDIDWATELANALGVKLELIEATSPNRIPILLSGKADCTIAGLAITLERATAVEFTDPYVRNVLILLARKESGITTLEDLKRGNYKIGFVRGTNPDLVLTPLLKKWNVADSRIVRYESNAEQIMALNQKKIDVLAESEIWCLRMAGENPNLVPIYPPYKSEFCGIAVRRGDQIWLNWLNQFVFQMHESGRTAEIWEQWYGFPGPQRLNPELPVIR